jgi:hypothetical protein
MKNGKIIIPRDAFFVKRLISFISSSTQACQEKVIQVLIRLSGTNHILGLSIAHQKLSKPTKQIHILFNCGGGISGLSAARQFSKGIHDFSGGIRKSFGRKFIKWRK